MATIQVYNGANAVCNPPVLTSNTGSVGTSYTFNFCFISYATNIFDEFTSAVYWSSQISGTITATSTTSAGQYRVTAIAGTRSVTNNDGSQSINNTVLVSLLAGGPYYVYVSSPLMWANASVDSTGVGFSLAAAQTDPTGCSGSWLILSGQTIQCPNINLTASFSDTQTVTPQSQSASCAPITYSITPYQCGIGSYDFTSLRYGSDLSVTMNGYTIFFRPCGAVSQSDCVRTFGQNSMVCQWSAPTNLYEISSNISPYGQPTFSYVNGVDASSGNITIVVIV